MLISNQAGAGERAASYRLNRRCRRFPQPNSFNCVGISGISIGVGGFLCLLGRIPEVYPWG